MAAAFLDLADFVDEFGALSDAQTITAERLLQVASDRVRELVTDPNEFAAKQVVYEIVRDAITYGAMEKLSSFSNVTSKRTEAGTFDEAMKVVDDLLSGRHKRLLGIPGTLAARGHFPKCDY